MQSGNDLDRVAVGKAKQRRMELLVLLLLVLIHNSRFIVTFKF